LKRSSQRSREELLRKVERLNRTLDAEDSQQVPDDPVKFCQNWLGYEPFKYMYAFLQDKHHFIANVQARQTGKTFNGMAKLLWFGFRYPGSLILVTAPKFDQAKNIAFKALGEHLKRMKAVRPKVYETHFGDRNVLRTIIQFRNGSQILAESPIRSPGDRRCANRPRWRRCNPPTRSGDRSHGASPPSGPSPSPPLSRR